MDDLELLREYIEHRSQDAFGELVKRHLPMVYSAARRMVGDSHLAEEVAQGVFTTLAQKAGSLAPPRVVGGWLYNTTRHLAMHTVRTEQRRREREQTAATMHSFETNPDAERIAEQLEPLMDKLDADERDVLVLRFLQDRSLREVGAELGISEDAARMRVNRALEQLRGLFARQGLPLTSTLLASALVATTVKAVPSGLGATIVASAFAGTIISTATATHTVITTMSWINTKSMAAIVGAAVIAATSTYLVEQHEIKSLRADNEGLFAAQTKLKTENDAVTAAAQARSDELERRQQDNGELLRLRNEVGQLKQQQRDAEKRLAQQTAQPKTASPLSPPAATYISKERVAYAGYSTPEAALQTITWATFKGTPEQMAEGLSPQLLGNPEAYKDFESGRKQGAPLLKGLQIMAKKMLTESEVEMKLRVDTEPIPGNPSAEIPMTILPMVKVGNEWKVGTSTRNYEPSWDKSGQIEILAQ